MLMVTMSMSRGLPQNRVIQRIQNVIWMMHLRLIQINEQVEELSEQRLVIGVTLTVNMII